MNLRPPIIEMTRKDLIRYGYIKPKK